MTGDAYLTGAASGGASRADAQVFMLDQAFDSGSLHALRTALQAHARQVGLPAELADDLVLAVHELAANAIEHGAGRGQLRLWHAPGALCCEITDAGRAARPAQARPPAQAGPPVHSGPQTRPGHRTAAPPSPGDPGQAAGRASFPVEPGHGLWLAQQVATRLDLWSDGHGTRALLVFPLPAAE